MSDSLQTHGLQHVRLPCPSLSPRICSNSWLLSQWCYPTISSSVFPFSTCLQSFSASESFPMSWLFPSSSQGSGASASATVLPVKGWFPLRINWFDLDVQGFLKSLLEHHISKASVLQHLALFMVQLSHPYMTMEKTIAWTIPTFVSKGTMLTLLAK